jgi:hypothetical protein
MRLRTPSFRRPWTAADRVVEAVPVGTVAAKTATASAVGADRWSRSALQMPRPRDAFSAAAAFAPAAPPPSPCGGRIPQADRPDRAARPPRWADGKSAPPPHFAMRQDLRLTCGWVSLGCPKTLRQRPLRAPNDRQHPSPLSQNYYTTVYLRKQPLQRSTRAVAGQLCTIARPAEAAIGRDRPRPAPPYLSRELDTYVHPRRGMPDAGFRRRRDASTAGCVDGGMRRGERRGGGVGRAGVSRRRPAPR